VHDDLHTDHAFISTMTSPALASDIFSTNPYESHPSLTVTEAEVLWEYAKLAQHVKLVCASDC
jgi:hypothetical protein